MIKDFLFIVKMLGLTAVVIIAMQVHLNGKTVEDHFHDWLEDSILVDYIQEATDGGIALTKVGYQKADHGVHTVMGKLKRKHHSTGWSFFKHSDDEEKNDEKSAESEAQAKAHTPHPH